jgi:hypothetical protein
VLTSVSKGEDLIGSIAAVNISRLLLIIAFMIAHGQNPWSAWTILAALGLSFNLIQLADQCGEEKRILKLPVYNHPEVVQGILKSANVVQHVWNRVHLSFVDIFLCVYFEFLVEIDARAWPVSVIRHKGFLLRNAVKVVTRLRVDHTQEVIVSVSVHFSWRKITAPRTPPASGRWSYHQWRTEPI